MASLEKELEPLVQVVVVDPSLIDLEAASRSIPLDSVNVGDKKVQFVHLQPVNNEPTDSTKAKKERKSRSMEAKFLGSIIAIATILFTITFSCVLVTTLTPSLYFTAGYTLYTTFNQIGIEYDFHLLWTYIKVGSIGGATFGALVLTPMVIITVLIVFGLRFIRGKKMTKADLKKMLEKWNESTKQKIYVSIRDVIVSASMFFVGLYVVKNWYFGGVIPEGHDFLLVDPKLGATVSVFGQCWSYFWAEVYRRWMARKQATTPSA
ncbi:hypothetical protein C8Q75DRAFT_20740 [Abortiporus biennis]|nr:hypothetical protein C8Q75DRAFT_20740 [Abortiporus biennis]